MPEGSLHLFLVRHAEARQDSPAEPDPPLTAHGRAQAGVLAIWLRELRPDALVSSTLRRAAETAAIAGDCLGLPVRYESWLREVGHCWPDGRPIDGPRPERVGFAPRDQPLRSVFPGGERWLDLRARVDRGTSELLARWDGTNSRVVVFCHGGIVDAFFDNITGAETASPVETALAHTGISHFEHRRDPAESPWVLHTHNHLPHMTGELGGACATRPDGMHGTACPADTPA
jgi:broad specificity phosphatase PhoE